MAGYRYNYSALMNANPAVENNFLPLNQVADTNAFNNMVTGLLEQKGITAGSTQSNSIIDTIKAGAGDSQISAFQNIAGLTEEQTAVERGDIWGGSDDSMGRSWLEKIVSGGINTEEQGIGIEDLYTRGFGRGSDEEGFNYWTGELGKGMSLQKIAESFLGSEESDIRSSYHDYYQRDIDDEGLEYWMTVTPDEARSQEQLDQEGVDFSGHGDFNAGDLVRESLEARGDYEQYESTIRDLFSNELGQHSTDAQRNADVSLNTDGIVGADVFTAPDNTIVERMRQAAVAAAAANAQSSPPVPEGTDSASSPLVTAEGIGEAETFDPLAAARQEIDDKKTMQTAAQYMGDYGGGVEDVGATNISRILAEAEMGEVTTDPETNIQTWNVDEERINRDADSYLPVVDPDTGDTTNQWGLLKDNTQDYTEEDVVKAVTEGTGGPPGDGGGTDTVVADGTDTVVDDGTDTVVADGTDTVLGGENFESDVTIETTEDEEDDDTFEQVTTRFEEEATDAEQEANNIYHQDPVTGAVTSADMNIRDSAYVKSGGDARGVRLKRSKKFKSGESALGTKQFGRRLQIKSLNI